MNISVFPIRITFITISIGVLLSCKHDPDNLNNMPEVCFDSQIMPMLSTCTRCHGNGRSEGGFDPTSYSTIMKSVKPGDPWASKLYTIVSEPNNPNMMPPNGNEPLTLEQRTLLEIWIYQGAKETSCSNSTKGTTQRDTISRSQD